MDVSSSLGAHDEEFEGINEFDDFTQPQELPGTTGAPWSGEEQQHLEQLLARHPAERHSSPAERFIVIAACLPNKTARDVALRVKWMAMRSCKRRHGVEGSPHSFKSSFPFQQQHQQQQMPQGSMRSSLHKALSLPLAASSRPGSSGNLVSMASLHAGMQSTATPPSFFPLQPQHGSPACHTSNSSLPNVHTSNSSGTGTENHSMQGSDEHALAAANVGINSQGMPSSMAPPGPQLQSSLPGPGPMSAHNPMLLGPMGSVPPAQAKAMIYGMLNQNCSLLVSIKANMEHCKVVENSELLGRYRDNILAVMQQMDSMTGMWQQMPPLPVQPNFEMAACVLPPPRPPALATGPLPGAMAAGGATMIGPSAPGMSFMPGGMMMPHAGMLGMSPPGMGMGMGLGMGMGMGMMGGPGMVPPGFPAFPPGAGFGGPGGLPGFTSSFPGGPFMPPGGAGSGPLYSDSGPSSGQLSGAPHGMMQGAGAGGMMPQGGVGMAPFPCAGFGPMGMGMGPPMGAYANPSMYPGMVPGLGHMMAGGGAGSMMAPPTT